MKQLCQEMAGEYLSQDKTKHASLAKQCSEHIGKEKEAGIKNAKHFKKLQQICTKMTGEAGI